MCFFDTCVNALSNGLFNKTVQMNFREQTNRKYNFTILLLYNIWRRWVEYEIKQQHIQMEATRRMDFFNTKPEDVRGRNDNAL